MIRQAMNNDLKEIVRVHIKCFPDSFSTALGTEDCDLLTSYYRQFMNEKPELFIVSENSGGINGFCMGYLIGGKSVTKEWFRQRGFRISIVMTLLLVKGNKVAWSKLGSLRKRGETTEYVDETYDSIDGKQKVDLLSICVLPECRGNGTASELIEEYEKRGSLLGREYCVLTVRTDNERGIRFYEKQGYRPRKKTDEKISMIKKI